MEKGIVLVNSSQLGTMKACQRAEEVLNSGGRVILTECGVPFSTFVLRGNEFEEVRLEVVNVREPG